MGSGSAFAEPAIERAFARPVGSLGRDDTVLNFKNLPRLERDKTLARNLGFVECGV
jgi:hypothetical protein